MIDKCERQGIIYVSISFLLWGTLPIYWHKLQSISSELILASRIIWSAIFMVFFLFFRGKLGILMENFKKPQFNYKSFLLLILASFLVSFNWGTYIWAVNNGYIVESSLGYYIGPLINILIGFFALKEHLNKVQILSLFIAMIGVGLLTYEFGSIPWYGLILAFTFSTYGLLKKKLSIEPAVGLTLETLFVFPMAIGYLFFIEDGTLLSLTIFQWLLLMGAGIVTAVPLLCFAKGAKLVSLSTLGFLQYITPTLMLFIGIFVYQETFSIRHFSAFSFIWLALLIFSASKLKIFQYKFKS